MKPTQILAAVATIVIMGSGLAAMVWAASQTASVPHSHPVAVTAKRSGKKGITGSSQITPPSILTLRRHGPS